MFVSVFVWEGARIVTVARGASGLEAAAVAIRAAGSPFTVASRSRIDREIANIKDCFLGLF